MARGQRTFLQLVNRVLLRLGKSQTTTTLSSAAADSWPGVVRDTMVDAQAALMMEHDWSTLYTSRTFTTSSRTVDMSTITTTPTGAFTDFLREISLADTTNGIFLQSISAAEIDAVDPELDDTGSPSVYSIQYPNLLFNRTPSSVAYRLRYIQRDTAFSANGDTSLLPEYCDDVMVDWTVRELLQTREDADPASAALAERRYRESLARAMAQDIRRMDRVWALQPMYRPASAALRPFPLPSAYPVSW